MRAGASSFPGRVPELADRRRCVIGPPGRRYRARRRDAIAVLPGAGASTAPTPGYPRGREPQPKDLQAGPCPCYCAADDSALQEPKNLRADFYASAASMKLAERPADRVAPAAI